MAKFNEKTIEMILKAHESGLNQKECAEVAGINEATLYKWINKGKEAKRGKYRDFYNDFQMAKNKNKLFHLKKIHEAEAWTASAWYLERIYPDEFGRKDRVDLKHEAQVEVSKTIKEEEKEAEEYFKQLENEMTEDK